MADTGERGDSGIQGAAGERGPTGDHGQKGDVGEQGPKGQSFLNFTKLQLLAFLFVAVFAVWGNYQVYQLAQGNKSTLDGVLVNRDLNCRAAESKHKEEIDDLKDSYAILKDPPAVYDELLKNPVVLNDFRDTILAAANDEDTAGEFVAPSCDEEGFGLPEPDPENLPVPDYVEELLPGITEQVMDAEVGGVEEAEANAQKP